MRAFRARDYDIARRILRRSLRKDPQDAKAWALLGEVHWVLDRKRLAVRALRSATRLDSRDAYSFMRLGDILSELDGAAPRAIAAQQRATRLDPRLSGVWRLLAEAYEADGRTVRAVAAYRRHLLLERGDKMARVQLGNALARLGRLAQAEKELRGAARRDPRDPDAVFGLGEVYQPHVPPRCVSAYQAGRGPRAARAARPGGGAGPRRGPDRTRLATLRAQLPALKSPGVPWQCKAARRPGAKGVLPPSHPP